MKSQKPRKVLVNMDEQKMEVHQKLSYFCMAHRKDQKFKKPNSCNDFTSSILSNCENDFDWGDIL